MGDAGCIYPSSARRRSRTTVNCSGAGGGVTTTGAGVAVTRPEPPEVDPPERGADATGRDDPVCVDLAGAAAVGAGELTAG